MSTYPDHGVVVRMDYQWNGQQVTLHEAVIPCRPPCPMACRCLCHTSPLYREYLERQAG